MRAAVREQGNDVKLGRMPLSAMMISFLMLIASCGGGGGGPSTSPSGGAPAIADTSLTITGWTHSPVFPSSVLRPVATTAAVEPTNLFDWAESRYPQYFPGHRENQSWAPYIYRYYPETNTYLAVDGIYVRMLGPAFGPDIREIGTLAQFACDIFPETCVAPPTADAGAAQVVLAGSLVTLDGRGSTDPNNRPLAFSWTITGKPAGSLSTGLSGANTAQPTFTADVPGIYIAALVVNNGMQQSVPQIVTITAL